jgi:hypothetical protein
MLIYADLVALRHRGRAGHSGVVTTPPAAGHLATAPATGGRAIAWLRRIWYSGCLAGVGVGLASAIKITPTIFILYFAVTRQWRTMAVSVATAVGATAFTFAVAGSTAARYFTSVMLDTSRVGQVDATANQSLAGVLARLYDSPTAPVLMWLAFGALLLAVGLSRASTAHREGDELAAFTIIGLTGNAICPISWSHHLVFVIPAVVILVDLALRRFSAARAFAGHGVFRRGPAGVPILAAARHGVAAVAVYLLFVISPIWAFQHRLPQVSHYADGLHGAVWENSLALAVITLVVLLPWRTGAEPAFPPAKRRRVPRPESVALNHADHRA